MKRFWKDVTVGADRTIALDGRPVRTPGRVPLALPTDALAQAVADEWRGVGETLDPRAMPLTGLANAAIDRIAPDAPAFAAGLAAYGESDLLYYRAVDPPELVARQEAAWDPLLDWARGRYDVHFEPTAGIVHRAQPPATLARLAEAVAAYDPLPPRRAVAGGDDHRLAGRRAGAGRGWCRARQSVARGAGRRGLAGGTMGHRPAGRTGARRAAA